MTKLTHKVTFVFTILLLTAITSLMAQSATPLVGQAVAAAAIRPAPADSAFATPQPGLVQECAGIDRQFYLLNPKVVAGEPVAFRLVLKTSEPDSKPEYNGRMVVGTDIKVLVYPPKESGIRPYNYVGLNLGSVMPNATLKFDGFSTYRHDFYLAVDKESISGAAFEFPGTYQLKVLMNCYYQGAQMGQMDMGVFTLEVTEPKGDDLMASEILADDYTIFEYFQLRGASYPNQRDPMTSDQAQILLQLIEKCPQAAIRPHAMILMASYYLHQDQPEKAIELDNQIQKEYPNLPIFEEARYDELATHLTYGEEEQAFEVFKEIWADPYSTHTVYPGGSNYNKWVKKRLPRGAYTQWMITDALSQDPEMIKEQEQGQKIALSPEIQAQLGLSGEVTMDQLNEALNQALSNNPNPSMFEIGE